MAKGLLVDYGGVLTTSVLDAFAAFAVAEGVDPGALAATMRGVIAEPEPDNFFRRVETGEIDTDEFEVLFAGAISDRCGIHVQADGLKSRMFAFAQPDVRMLDMLRHARKAAVKTALVSNSWGVTGGGYPVESFPELFDAVVLSGEVRLRKPDPEIYLLAAERIGVDPDQCVFVDDFKVNADGAEAVGMIGLHHVDTDRTIERLEALFATPLR